MTENSKAKYKRVIQSPLICFIRGGIQDEKENNWYFDLYTFDF